MSDFFPFPLKHTVCPAVGRIVSFESSNYHGVEALTKGKRYALAMWFTLDPKEKEATYEATEKIVKDKKSRQESIQLKSEELKDEL